MASVCVFCGSGVGNNPLYADTARRLGELLAASETTLVFGGGKVGLMGIVADTVMKNSGKAIGVIPYFLYQLEVGHDGLTQLEIVQSMHERKKRMADLTDAFIAIPGGWGTLDELAEILTWRQLGIINKPIGLLNVNGFFQPLIDQFNLMTREGFLKESNNQLLTIDDDPARLLTRLGVVTT